LRNVFPVFQYAPVDLVAVCDLSEARACSSARLFGASSVYTDFRTMLETERPDVVFVVLNYDEGGHPRYPSIAMEAMRAGAHVWMEKPPAASVEEIRQMMQVMDETGRFVSVGFKKMFFPANVKAKEIILRPEFGPISTITARYPQSLPPQEVRGDALRMVGFLDHVVHPFSVLRYLAGPIESLRFEREERTGATLTTIRFISGALGSLHLCAGQSGLSPLERTEVVGQGNNIVIENNIRVTYYRSGTVPGAYGHAGNFYGDDATAPLQWEPEFSLGQLYNKGLFLLGYAPEILYFCDCALMNQPPSIGNLADALELMVIYEAYRQPDGRSVSIHEKL
jgi:predicted dehydrogenase